MYTHKVLTKAFQKGGFAMIHFLYAYPHLEQELYKMTNICLTILIHNTMSSLTLCFKLKKTARNKLKKCGGSR